MLLAGRCSSSRTLQPESTDEPGRTWVPPTRGYSRAATSSRVSRQIPSGQRFSSDRDPGLHVDDEAPIRLLSRVNLEAEGMEVIEAANGRTGVGLAKRELPDLILLGVMMPVLDGWQAAEELAKDPETREIPIVFLTARSAPMIAPAGSTSAPSTTSSSPSTPRSWPNASAGCWNGSSAASGTSCGARTSRSCARS